MPISSSSLHVGRELLGAADHPEADVVLEQRAELEIFAVDSVGQVRVEIAQRVVGQGGQMHDRVEAGEIAGLDVAQVLAQLGDVRQWLHLHPGIEPAVEPHDLMAGITHHRCQHRSDIAEMTRHQHPHASSPANPPPSRTSRQLHDLGAQGETQACGCALQSHPGVIAMFASLAALQHARRWQ